MAVTIWYQQQRFMVTNLWGSSLLMRIYGVIRWLSPFHIFGEGQKMSPKLIGDCQKILWIFNDHHYWCIYMVTFIDCHQKSHFQKYKCCGDIQGLSWIMTIMMDNEHHHFISTTTIYGYEPLRVITIDAYIWWHSLTITISHFLWGSKNVTIAHLWWSKEPLLEKNWSTPFHMDVRAWWNRTINLLLVKEVLFHWSSTI